MGFLSSLISGAFDTAISFDNRNAQAAENQRARDFAESQQSDAQAFNAEEAQKGRDFAQSQQEDAQAFNAAMQEDAQAFNASEAALNREFQSKEAEAAFEREREFYEQYQSIGAQVRQYKEAGLNPALLAGGVSVGSTPSSPSAAGSAASSGATSSGAISAASASSSPIAAAMAALPEIAMIGKHMAEIANIKADTNLKDEQAGKTSKESSWIDRLNSKSLAVSDSVISQAKSNIAVNEQSINESAQRVSESIKRISVMDSQIEVNGSVVELNLSTKQLNMVKSKVENLNAKSIEQMLPFIEARQQAEIALTNAKSETERYVAEDKMYEANLKMLKGLVEADLIDKGYYDSVVESAGWSAKQAKRNYKFTPVNNICTAFRDICVGVGCFL